MAGIRFLIGEILPAADPVARFLTGLCLITNDLTFIANGGQNGAASDRAPLSLRHLHLMSAHLREATKYLHDALQDESARAFLSGLSDEGRQRLTRVESSFTPWQGSFVQSRLKPLRDAVFHYLESGPEQLGALLAAAKGIESGVDLGAGTYYETDYAFGHEVVNQYLLRSWGTDSDVLEETMLRVTDLFLDFAFLTHEAMSLWLDRAKEAGISIHVHQ